jgi:hypothetical protein
MSLFKFHRIANIAHAFREGRLSKGLARIFSSRSLSSQEHWRHLIISTVRSAYSRILRNFVQFGGHASRTPCAAMNFGFGHGSRHPVPNVKCVTSGPNLPWRCKKGRIFKKFRLQCRIFGGVTPKFVGCRSAESVFWVTSHNPCRIERNCAVY